MHWREWQALFKASMRFYPGNPHRLMKSIGSFFRAGVIFCLSLLAGTAVGQTLVGTNTPDTARNYTFATVTGVTNFSLVVSGSVSTFSHLLVRRGVPATDTDYEWSSTWNGTTNWIYLESAQVMPTNWHNRVRTPSISLTHSFTVLVRTNTGLFKTASKPVCKPITSGTPIAAW